MSDAEARLAAFWREDRPKISDAAFRLAVLERRARQRLYRDVALIVSIGVFALVCVAQMSSGMSAMVASLRAPLELPLLSVAGTFVAMAWLYTRIRQTF